MEANDPRLTFGRFVAEVAGSFSERPAIRFEGRTITYAELESDARQLARALVGAGVVKGARVAIHMPNRPEWIAATFAVGMSGGVVVPVNTFATSQEFDYILRHSDASLLLMQPSLRKRDYLEELVTAHPEIASGRPGRLYCTAFPQLRRVVCLELPETRGGVGTWDALLAMGGDVPEELVDAACAEVEPSDDGILIYTSGTTANPKGVLHAQRAGVLQSWRFADLLLFEPEDRVYTTYPFFWTAGFAMSIGPTFAVGACLLLQQTFEAGAALDMIEGERATVVHAWPHQQKAMVEHPSAGERDLGALRKIDASSPLAALVGIEEDEYGTGASYGLSETFTISSMLRCNAPVARRRNTSGKPLDGMTLRIVDPKTGERLPPGREGEIAVKGVTLMRGYHKVLPENFLDADGFFRTQDGGSLDRDGYLHWSGRLSNLIKTGGANVSPVEVGAIAARHPAVKMAVPVGIGHPTMGEVVVLCAVPVEGAELDENEIRAYLRERLASYKVPRRVLTFRADELSYTGNQKVQVEPLAEAARKRLEAEGAEIDGYRYQKT